MVTTYVSLANYPRLADRKSTKLEEFTPDAQISRVWRPLSFDMFLHHPGYRYMLCVSG